MKYRWHKRFDKISIEQADALRKDLVKSGISLTVNQVRFLAGRGYGSVESISLFLKSFKTFSPADFMDPFRLPDMDRAVDRIRTAIKKDEKILIFGDYDCDGITSISIIYNYFKTYYPQIAVHTYQPSRFGKGYGFNSDGVQEAVKLGATLIITVDCGVSDVVEVQSALNQGVDVIVTDHHEVPDVLPSAVAVLDPKRHDFDYPFKSWAGAGVAFCLVLALARSDPGIAGSFKMGAFLELAAIGTVGDIVPLSHDNRTIVKAGFRILDTVISGEKGMNKGLRLIRKYSGDMEQPIVSKAVSHGIVPRLNAAGRVGDASLATRLLISQDEHEVEQLASELETMNTKRKKIQDELGRRIEEEVRGNITYARKKIIIYSGEGIDEGVRGIVAGKIAELFFKPTIIFSLDRVSGMAVGSARSVDGLNLFDLLKQLEAKKYYEKWGGHAGAAGMSVKLQLFESFVRDLETLADKEITSEMLVPTLEIDAVLGLEEARPDYGNFLAQLEPFGQANEPPLFMLENVRINDIFVNTYYDKNRNQIRHFLKIGIVSSDDLFRNSVTLWEPENFFGIKDMEKFEKKVLVGQSVDMVVIVSIQEKNGQTYFNLNMKDMDIRS